MHAAPTRGQLFDVYGKRVVRNVFDTFDRFHKAVAKSANKKRPATYSLLDLVRFTASTAAMAVGSICKRSSLSVADAGTMKHAFLMAFEGTLTMVAPDLFPAPAQAAPEQPPEQPPEQLQA